MRSYGIGPNFRGVKMVPPGLHLVTYGTGLERVGVFLQFSAGPAAGSNVPLGAAARASAHCSRRPPPHPQTHPLDLRGAPAPRECR